MKYIKRFDITKMKTDSVVLLIGKRRTGKSFLLRDILYHKRQQLPAGIVISGTEEVSPYFKNFIPKMFIHYEYSTEILSNLFKRQQKAFQENWATPECFLLMDDCIDDSAKWSKEKVVKTIFVNGRHYKIMFLLAMQIAMAIPPGLRGNVDYVFLTKNNNNLEIEKIYKNYAGMFKSLKEFKLVLDKCTNDNNVLVIDTTNTSNKIEETVFFYKAENHENFRMFSDKIWQENDKIYRNKQMYNRNNIELN